MAVKTGLDGLVLARTTFCMTSSLEPWWTVVVAVEAEEMCIFAATSKWSRRNLFELFTMRRTISTIGAKHPEVFA